MADQAGTTTAGGVNEAPAGQQAPAVDPAKELADAKAELAKLREYQSKVNAEAKASREKAEAEAKRAADAERMKAEAEGRWQDVAKAEAAKREAAEKEAAALRDRAAIAERYEATIASEAKAIEATLDPALIASVAHIQNPADRLPILRAFAQKAAGPGSVKAPPASNPAAPAPTMQTGALTRDDLRKLPVKELDKLLGFGR